MKIPNKRKCQQIASNHLPDIDFKDFMKLCKECTKEPYSFFVNDTTLASDNPSQFRTMCICEKIKSTDNIIE